MVRFDGTSAFKAMYHQHILLAQDKTVRCVGPWVGNVYDREPPEMLDVMGGATTPVI